MNSFETAKIFWSKIPPTKKEMSGMSGGDDLMDIRESGYFLDHFPWFRKARLRILDLGCGIGRVSSDLFVPYFEKIAQRMDLDLDLKIDLLDMDARFLKIAKDKLGKYCRNVHQMGIQEYGSNTQDCKYDIIWMQFVCLYITNDDFVPLLQKLKASLNDGGRIFIKANVCLTGNHFDERDASCIRNQQELETIFLNAGLKIQKKIQQVAQPKGYFPIWMYCLHP